MQKDQDTEWRDGFLFVGNSLALDFVNTWPILNGETVELLPDFKALVRWFQAAGELGASDAQALRRRWGKSATTSNFVKRVREFRERLRNEVLRWENGSALPPQTIKE